MDLESRLRSAATFLTRSSPRRESERVRASDWMQFSESFESTEAMYT